MYTAENTAYTYGGVLYTDLYEPSMTNITTSNNIADGGYGDNYAAYPITIEIGIDEGEELIIVSGNTFDTPLEYIAYDFFGQNAINLGNRLAALQIESVDIQLEEQNRASSQDGVFMFEDTIITGQPGTYGVLTFLTSSIDLDKYAAVYGESLDSLIINTTFEIRY